MMSVEPYVFSEWEQQNPPGTMQSPLPTMGHCPALHIQSYISLHVPDYFKVYHLSYIY